MNSINRVETDNLEFTGGAIIAFYLLGAFVLCLQYVNPL